MADLHFVKRIPQIIKKIAQKISNDVSAKNLSSRFSLLLSTMAKDEGRSVPGILPGRVTFWHFVKNF